MRSSQKSLDEDNKTNNEKAILKLNFLPPPSPGHPTNTQAIYLTNTVEVGVLGLSGFACGEGAGRGHTSQAPSLAPQLPPCGALGRHI